MNQLTVANFNAYQIFESGIHPDATLQETERLWQPVYEELDGMDPERQIDVLHMPETASRLSDEQMDVMRVGMKGIGWVQGIKQNSPRWDGLEQSMWTRDGVEGDLRLVTVRHEGLEMQLPQLRIEGVLELFGIHRPSEDEAKRVAISHAIVGHAVDLERKELAAGVPVDKLTAVGVVEDANGAFRNASTTTRLLHAVDPLVNNFPGVRGMKGQDYFNEVQTPLLRNLPKANKIKGLVSAGARAAAMTRGEALQVMEDGGFVNAAKQFNDFTPTAHGSLGFQIDQISLRSRNDRAKIVGYTVVPAISQKTGERISDHDEAVATLAW